MNAATDTPEVLAYRLQRVQNAPRNWAYWIAGFTVANGVFMLAGSDVMFLAGLVAPYLIEGAPAQLVAGATLFLLARGLPERQLGVVIVLALYGLDTILAGVLQLWSGVALHAFVFAMLLLARLAVKSLSRQHHKASAQQSPSAETAAAGLEAKP